MAGNIKSQIGGAGSTTGGFPVNTSRRIDTTSPLAGGGDLSADRTISIDTSAFVLTAANNVFTGQNRFTGSPTRFGDVITGPLQVSGMLFVYGQLFIGSQSGASRVLTSGDITFGNFALRNAANFFTGSPNVFGGAVTAVSGSLIAGAGFQASGVTVHYAPIYQGAQSGTSRYVMSGELGSVVPGDAALRGAVNFFSQNNIFGVDVTISGTATHAIDGRYLPSGELGAQNFARRTTANYFANQTNVFTGSLTLSGGAAAKAPITILPGTSTATALQVAGSVPSVSSLVSFAQTSPFSSASASALLVEQQGSGIVARFYYTDGMEIAPGVNLYPFNSMIGNNTQVSGELIVSKQLWHNAQIGQNRYLPSGELRAGAGSGDAIKNTSNYWGPSTANVYADTATIQASGLVSFGSKGGTRISPQMDAQVSGTLGIYGKVNVIGAAGQTVDAPAWYSPNTYGQSVRTGLLTFEWSNTTISGEYGQFTQRICKDGTDTPAYRFGSTANERAGGGNVPTSFLVVSGNVYGTSIQGNATEIKFDIFQAPFDFGVTTNRTVSGAVLLGLYSNMLILPIITVESPMAAMAGFYYAPTITTPGFRPQQLASSFFNAFTDRATVSLSTQSGTQSLGTYQSFASAPNFTRPTGLVAWSGTTVQGYSFAPTVNANVIIGNLVGAAVIDAAGIGAVTNQVGVDVGALTQGQLNIGIRNAAQQVYVPGAVQTLAAGTAISANAPVVLVSGTSASTITLTATPTISGGTEGSRVTLFNVGSTTIALQNGPTFGLALPGATTLNLAYLDSADLIYINRVARWIVRGTSNN